MQTLKCLILKEKNVGEINKSISVLTAEKGVIDTRRTDPVLS